MPDRELPWRQFRALGSSALALCDVAAGHLDGLLDATHDSTPPVGLPRRHCSCVARRVRRSSTCSGRELVVADPGARRQLVAAGTPELLDALRDGVA